MRNANKKNRKTTAAATEEKENIMNAVRLLFVRRTIVNINNLLLRLPLVHAKLYPSCHHKILQSCARSLNIFLKINLIILKDICIHYQS
jgi:hypothetical protein